MALLLLVPVWWTWVGVTFCTDRFPTDDVLERALILTAAAAVGVMGLALSGMPRSGAVPFAAGYAVVRLVLVVLYVRAARAVPARAGHVRWYTVGFAVTAGIWLVSVTVPAPARWLVWTVAMIVDVGIPAVSDRRRGLLPVDIQHLPERFAAFVIIVLGESLITTGTLAVDTGPRTAAQTVVLAEGFVLAVALWWGFFDRGAWRRRYERLEGDDSGRLANIVCAYLHFPLVAGISLIAVGVQLTVTSADHAVPVAAVLTVTGGAAAYLLALNLMTVVLQIPRAGSLSRHRLLLAATLAALAAAGRHWSSGLFLGLCTAVLLVHVAANLARARNHHTSAPS